MAKITSVKEAKAHVKNSKAGKPNDFRHVDEKDVVTKDNYWVCEDGNIFTDYNSANGYASKRKLTLYHYGTPVKKS